MSVLLRNLKKLIIKDLLKYPVINHFGDNFSKKVLISYITKPFKKGVDFAHTNSVEVLEIAKIFRSLGFNVDAADYDYDGFLNYDKYDLIFGFGEPLEKSFYKRNRKTVTVFYGTGMHLIVQNINTTGRLREIYKEKKKWLPDSARIVEKTWSIQTSSSDAAIILGNEISRDSFADFFHGDLFNLIPSFYKIYDYKNIISKKDFSSAGKHFLWFGNKGFVHKGLDILLGIFKENPNINLHVCGPIDKEPEFKTVFFEELYNYPNIKTYGFVNLKSEKFEELITKCAFLIFPTCSEGGSPSVLNVCGNGGLIPIVTKEVTIDVEDFGLMINSLDKLSIEKSIFESQKLSESEIKRRSEISGEKISRYSLDLFSKQMKKYLEVICKKHGLEL